MTKSFITSSSSRLSAPFHLNRLFMNLLFLTALIFLTSSSLLAQGRGRISGIISDTTGAVVPGATVSVTQVGTGTKTEVKTNGEGEYIFPSLPPATYDLSVASTGFSGYLQKGIVLAGRRSRLAERRPQDRQHHRDCHRHQRRTTGGYINRHNIPGDQQHRRE